MDGQRVPVPTCAECGAAIPGVRAFEPCPHCGRVYEPVEPAPDFPGFRNSLPYGILLGTVAVVGELAWWLAVHRFGMVPTRLKGRLLAWTPFMIVVVPAMAIVVIALVLRAAKAAELTRMRRARRRLL